MIKFWELSGVFILFGSVLCLKFGLFLLPNDCFIKRKSKSVNKQIHPYKF